MRCVLAKSCFLASSIGSTSPTNIAMRTSLATLDSIIALACILLLSVGVECTVASAASRSHSASSSANSAAVVDDALQLPSTIRDALVAERIHHSVKRQAKQYAMEEGGATSTSVGLTPTMVYNKDVADVLFWHSVTAYCVDNSSLLDWQCNSCLEFGDFTVTGILENTTTQNQGYVGYFTQGLPASPIDNGAGTSGVSASDPFIVVSFRGTTQSIADWLADLKFFKTQPFPNTYPDIEVHVGFWESYSVLKPQMMTAIQIALEASRAQTIIFTGHSLGAAMTELAALDLVLNEYPTLNYTIYTQGNPRPGNPAWAAMFNQTIAASFREVHYRDLVPHLPPEAFGFQHSGAEVWYDEAFDSYTLCEAGESDSCSDGLFFHESIDDHTHYRGIEVGDYCSTVQPPPPRKQPRM